MNAFEKKYKSEVFEKWGGTCAYKEHEEKTRGYSKEKWNSVSDGLDCVMEEFALSMKGGDAPESAKAQELVKKLKDYITNNFYNCTDEILSGLSQMYVLDERFRENIDRHANGTAEFIRRAVSIYCKK